jgi:hypothetical protein
MVKRPVINRPGRPPVQITRKGVSPEWANLPRRRCDDCGKTYKPARPLLEGQRGFCCDNCRKSYHKHGGAYRKLKVEMLKLLNHEMRAFEKRLREIVGEELESRGRSAAQLTAAIAQASPSPAAHRANR